MMAGASALVGALGDCDGMRLYLESKTGHAALSSSRTSALLPNVSKSAGCRRRRRLGGRLSQVATSTLQYVRIRAKKCV